jgi:peptidyl-prolyl cis-trans isomerase B (cyclophilin B)
VPPPRIRRPSSVIRLAALGPLLCAALLAGCGQNKPSKADAPAATSDKPAASAAADSCTYLKEGAAAREATLPPSTPDPARSMSIRTNRGDLGVTLLTDSAPCTANSFTSLAKQGYFDGTPCHRLVTAGIFVLQCGDPSGTGRGGPGYRFPDELTGKETYPAGTLAMANAGPDTNGSQFFIVYRDSPLPPSYTVFGQVDAAGLAVVKSVAKAGSDDSNGADDGAPLQKVTITSVE